MERSPFPLPSRPSLTIESVQVKECVHSDTLQRWAVKIMKMNGMAKKRFPDVIPAAEFE